MTVQDTRRVRRRVYRLGLLVSAAWLVVTVYWVTVVVRALLESSGTTLLERVATFDRYDRSIAYGALVACLLFATRLIMFVRWPDARLLWRNWRR